MANQSKPHEPPPHPPEPKPEAAVLKPEPPVRTIADEQRERSEEMQTVGVDAWKEAHDTRSPEERQQKPVAGVAHRPVEEHEARGGRR